MKHTQELNEALSELIKSILDAKDFVLAEAPEVIQQLLLFKAVECLVVMCIFPVALFVSYIIYRKRECFVEIEGALASGVLLCIPCLLVFYGKLIEYLKITLAPKVYLIEYAAGLVS